MIEIRFVEPLNEEGLLKQAFGGIQQPVWRFRLSLIASELQFP